MHLALTYTKLRLVMKIIHSTESRSEKDPCSERDVRSCQITQEKTIVASDLGTNTQNCIGERAHGRD